jgi:hypothetical protein
MEVDDGNHGKVCRKSYIRKFLFSDFAARKNFFLGLFYILNMGFVGGNFEREFF